MASGQRSTSSRVSTTTTTRTTTLDQQLFPNPHSPPPPIPDERPRPTLGDIPLAPRRVLRNGNNSRGSSRGSSVSGSRAGSRRSTISEGEKEGGGDMRGRLRELARGLGVAQRDEEPRRRRGDRAVAGVDIEVDELDSNDGDYQLSIVPGEGIDRSISNSPIPLPEPQPRARPGLGQAVPIPRLADPPRQNMTDLITAIIEDQNGDIQPIRRNASGRQAFPISRPTSSRESVSSNSSDIVITAHTTADLDRRFTAQEKGKGRAARDEPIEIVDDDDDEEEVEDESIQFMGTKRKRDIPQDGEFEVLSSEEEEVGGSEDEGLTIAEEEGLGSWTCPICFCAPEMAVITLCGHCLCGKCLFESMTAAIKRHQPPPPPPRGRKPAPPPPGPQIVRGTAKGGPREWNTETLSTAFLAFLHRPWEMSLTEAGIDPGLFALMRDSGEYELAKLENVVVREEFKGVWAMQAEAGGKKEYVIEGECPVCRNTIPGGFGPLGSGIGGVAPIMIRKYRHTKGPGQGWNNEFLGPHLRRISYIARLTL